MARPQRAGHRLHSKARLAAGERAVEQAALTSLMRLTAYAKAALAESGYDPATLDPNAKPWRDALTAEVTPAVTAVFTSAWSAVAHGVPDLDPGPYAVQHIEGVWNRLVGVSDDVFDSIRLELAAARQTGEGIKVLASHIDGYLTDAENWKGRAVTIARTEAIGANNAGARQAAHGVAQSLGVDPDAVAREWMATDDDRTRESHADADGQVILGFDSYYTVGGVDLAQPGDPDGPPEEVCNCRCVEVFYYPGDPDYDAVAGNAVAAAGTRRASMKRVPVMRARWARPDLPTIPSAGTVYVTPGRAHLVAAVDPTDDDTPTGAIVCALPAADDACQDIGPEQKHATLAYLGENLDETTLQAVKDAVAGYAGGSDLAPITFDVTGVETLGDGGARVWMLADGALRSFRDGVTALDPVGGLDADANDHPEFTPHVTVGYAPDGADALDVDTETAAAAVTSIRFDRLAVWAGTDQTEYPLSGATTDTEEPAVAASARLTAQARALVDRLVAGGYGTREEVTAALAAALVTPIRAAAGDPAPTPPPEEEMAAGDPAPPLDDAVAEEAEEMAPGYDKFWGVCMTEDSQTGDGRVFAPGAIVWGDLPMSAGWIPADGMGHDGAIVYGRIDTLARVGNAIAYTGTYDLGGAGWEVQRLVDGGFLQGLSVDVDDCEVEFLLPDGTVADPFDLMFPEDGDADDPIMTVMHGRIRSFAVCRVPAMEGSQAFIANGLPVGDGATKPAFGEAAPTEEEALPVMAAAVTAAAARGATVTPIRRPDAADFANPGLTVPTNLTVTADGRRVFGHLATWGVCHIGFDGVCIDPPASMNDYAYFAVGTVVCAGGEQVRVGQITMDTGHATLTQGWRPAAAHYDNTGTAVADIAIGQDDVGIWFSGCTRPGTPQHKIDELRATGKVSGDWREVVDGSGNLDLVAALAVNVPGFPIPHLAIGASGSRQTALVAAGMVPGDNGVVPGMDPATLEAIRDVVRAEMAADERRGRAVAASARIRPHRARAALARTGRRA